MKNKFIRWWNKKHLKLVDSDILSSAELKKLKIALNTKTLLYEDWNENCKLFRHKLYFAESIGPFSGMVYVCPDCNMKILVRPNNDSDLERIVVDI